MGCFLAFPAGIHKIAAMVAPTPRHEADPETDPAEKPTVGVVVLNWNAAWFTRRCLRSLSATEHPQDRLRILLADNGSVDGSLEELQAWLRRPGAPRVEVLRNASNLGFAEGCNRAIRLLMEPGPDRADHVALVNNDAWVEPDWLEPMLEVARAHPRCAAVAARIVLEPGFVGVEATAGDGALTLASVRWRGPDGSTCEMLDRVRVTGCSDEGALEWPARRIWRLAARSSATVWVPAGAAPCRIELRWVDDTGGEVVIEAPAGQDRTTLLNGLGTALNEVGEGYDIGYGEPTVPLGVGAEVDGFCGGAVLLRTEALEDVGLFDPAFFAYYEDTDLSWRMRRAGWEIRVAPRSVVHHAFGGSGGGGSKLHVFLDRRNWLLTNVRNGTAADRRRVAGAWRRATWRLFRANVFGLARRGRRPRWQPLATWCLALASAIGNLRKLRAAGAPGLLPTDEVRSRLQPPSRPQVPSLRPGGPLVVFLDCGETLKAGYRAGIQRVVCTLVRDVNDLDERIQLVPVRREERHGLYRRLTAAEYGSLLRAGLAPDVPVDRPLVAAAKRRTRRVLGAIGVLAASRAAREALFGRRRRALEDSLLMERFPAGSVLLEADAVWNDLTVDREQLLGSARDSGVHVASMIYDVLPFEHPEWFTAHLGEIFTAAVAAQLRHSELVLCPSEATGASVTSVCSGLGVGEPAVEVVPLGSAGPITAEARAADAPGQAPQGAAELPGELRSGRYLMVVGTLEPRKNQALALEVFDSLSREVGDLHLVLIGRHGWGVEALVERIEKHPSRGRRLHWFDDVHDDLLDVLYRHAFAVLVPSWSEGYGLPVVEALARGVPVVASSRGSVPEAGGDWVEYADPDDPGSWVRVLRRQLTDAEQRDRALARAGGFVATTPEETAEAIVDALVAAFPRP